MPRAEGSLVLWDESALAYDFGPGHPMSPVRLDLTVRLARSLGVLDRAGVRVEPLPTASEETLLQVHDAAYLQAVRAAATPSAEPDLAHGLGGDDVPCFAGMHDAAARIVGGSVRGARAVWSGEVRRAVNITGGMHHAMPGAASGFCVYNDAAVAITELLAAGAERVAYIDVDVHHGDGVQAAFEDDPRVLTISLHETPLTLFPGTGRAEEVGTGAGEGYAVNVPMPPGTRDAGWLRAFHAVVPPLLRSWRPQVLVTQHGCDSHVDDPLSNLALTVDGQRAAVRALHGLAEEVSDGRWLALGGGGYAVVDVVPRTWTHVLAEVTGDPIDPRTDTPGEWRDYVGRRYGRVAPRRMTDGGSVAYRDWDLGFDPADALDRSVVATRHASFPHHGLDVS